MDGWITIGAELSTNKFDKQVLELEKKMKKEEDKKIVIETKLSNQEQELEKAREKTDELAEAYERLKNVQDKLASGKASPGDFSTFQELEKSYGSLEKLGNSFDKALSKQDAIELKVTQTKNKYNELNEKVDEYKNKIEGIKLQKQLAEVEKLKNGFKGVGSSLQDAVRQAGRLVLGVFAIRSAYMALRQASSYLGTYDKQYAANLEYIKYSLTQVIAPVLRYIVSLAATLLSYINAIVQGWFGINLFSNASAKSFKDMKASTGGIGKATSGVAKAVKEIKKQLAGFDEMNILSNNENKDSGSSGGGGGAGVTMPNFDLSAMQAEVPKWLQWIIDNKDLVIAGLLGIAAALVALKLGASGLMALGIGIAVAGLVMLIKDVIDFIKDPSWEGFAKILLDISLILAGLTLVFVSLGKLNIATNLLGIATLIAGIAIAIQGVIAYLKDPSWENFGQIIQGIGIAVIGLGVIFLGLPGVIIGVIILIVGTIIKYWEEIKSFLQNGIDWLKGRSDWVHQMFGDTIGSIYDMFVNNLQLILNWFDTTSKAIKGILDGIIKFIKGVFTGDWKKAWEGIKQIFSNIWNIIKNTFLTVFQLIQNKVIVIGQTVGNLIANVFKGMVNAVLGAIETILNAPINTVNSMIGAVNKIPGVSMGTLPTFNLPRLKSGGIINMPNRGTLVGSAIAGESGREGVIPLTDEQAMAELGREIGKNVLVNLTNVTTMNGRVISREITKVRNQQDFAYNT